jgi:hypothetical protein
MLSGSVASVLLPVEEVQHHALLSDGYIRTSQAGTIIAHMATYALHCIIHLSKNTSMLNVGFRPYYHPL